MNVRSTSTIPYLGVVSAAGAVAGALIVWGPLLAQEATEAPNVTGRVVDATTGSPVWGAFVGLGSAEQGVFTDSAGVFILPVEPRPGYTLSVSQLGYGDAVLALEAGEASRFQEIGLEPDPVELEGLEIVSRRFTKRRNAAAVSVSYLDQEDLLRAPGQTAFDVAVRRAFLRPCGVGRGFEEWCVWSRGELVPPRVFVDEQPVPWWGVEWLRSFDPRALYLMEFYDHGRVIRVLTRWAVEERPEQIAALRNLPVVTPTFGSPFGRDRPRPRGMFSLDRPVFSQF